MFANYHTHTFRCHHAKGEDREFVEAAIASGFKVLGFADHCPWVYPYAYVSDCRMEPREVEGYFRSLTALRKEYADDIKIYIGFEAEYIPELIDAQDKLLAGYPTDYMILGQHSVGAEPYHPYTGVPDDSEAALAAYVDSCIAGMETGRYESTRLLSFDELCEVTVLSDEIIVCSVFDYLTAVKHKDAVAVLDCRQTVCDYDTRTAHRIQ